MSLVAPILDDRTFEQIRQDLIRRIPTYTPEWTNHNDSDPGIALLDLFAFLGESLLYRFNQIPETTKQAFLSLLQLPPRPARPAHALVVVDTDVPEGVQVLKGTELRAGSVSFETDDEVYGWPLEVVAVGKQEKLGQSEAVRNDVARRLGIASPNAIRFYDSVIVPTGTTSPTPPTLDVSSTVDETLWIAVLRKRSTDITKLQGTLFVGVAMDGRVDDDFDIEDLTVPQIASYRAPGARPSSPAMFWGLWAGPTADPAFDELTVLGDTTQGFTRSGIVKLQLPRSLPAIDLTTLPSSDEVSPPVLSDPEQAGRVIAWLQVRRPDGAGDAIGLVQWVGLNVVGVSQARTASVELLGSGSGDADQTFKLGHGNVLPGTVQLEVEEADGWRAWWEVAGFVLSQADDRHFVVDAQAGRIRFGVRCRRPQIGERIRARSYRYGGGLAGQVPASSITKISNVGGVKVYNPLPAIGGADQESVVDALDRIPEELSRRDRAVTGDDFIALAEETTGVARAEALKGFHPDAPHVDAAGVVSVIVFPDSDLRNPAAPRPDRRLLREVAEHLDQRRLITTELYVLPPTYRKVAVSVGVEVRDGYQVDAVRRWVELILRQYLAPVPPFGPDGEGWPLGRRIHRPELEAVAVQVEGVAFLGGLGLADVSTGMAVLTDTIHLDRWEVPELGQITVVEGSPLPPGDPITPPPPPSDDVFVPAPRDVC